MKLSAPKKITWIIALGLGIIALLLKYDIVKGYNTYAFWVALIAAALMLIATYVKGL